MNSKTRGRPEAKIVFPENGTFTIRSLATLNPGVTSVTLQSHVNSKIKENKVKFSAKQASIRGRAANVYEIA